MGTFSERLRTSMDAANMKAVELHELTGISKANIYREATNQNNEIYSKSHRH